MTNIENMQKYLATLRKTLGWTQADLARELGMSRVTVSYLETGRTRMSKVCYLAIESLVYRETDYFDEARVKEETYMAMVLLDCYINGGEYWFDSKEQMEDILETIEMLAEGSVSSRGERVEANKTFCKWMKSKYGMLFH